MKPFTLVAIALITSLLTSPLFGVAALREVIVSHADEKGVLQLYRMKEDGTSSRQLTQSKHGCRQPSCSPDGTKLAYVEQVGHALAIRISDPDGQNLLTLIKEGMNLFPSWLPDSEQLVWMKVKPQPKQDPARNAQIHLVNVRTGRRADSLPTRSN
jgi:Tol biopolymer transport system component